MQEKNIVANTYWADNERFADVINVGMFQAKKVLSAKQLSERDGYLGRVERRKKQDSIQRYRDVMKKADFGTNFMIIGIENQSELHLAMPVRVIRLQPICTLVIYYGKEPWTGPTRLSEMLDFGDLPEEVRNVIADYPIHVLDVRRFEDMILMGEERGEEHCEKRMMKLIQCMTEDGALESIPRIASEPLFYQEMLEKYHIGKEVAVS